ncbi:hypothetical protein [Chitinophaga filiformis]|uniref:Uncharacterized protein n=1 Tax=Chitinophaga filiformis TaxID=104663 RepID=A0ABY4HX92_CHIFI|nr:hypothetical protein [Chitinophaga filiformis]UPK68010.1 hypothetical protein MYF79_23950 [Chitinophaga filiformis]
MSKLQNEINRWLEVLENKGYFRNLNPEQNREMKEAFSLSIHGIFEKNKLVDTEKEDFVMAFQIYGQNSDIKWNSEFRIALNKNQEIEIAGSNISLENKNKGISFEVSSDKSLLDLDSILTIGQILPARLEFYQIPRHDRTFNPDKGKNQGPSLN